MMPLLRLSALALLAASAACSLSKPYPDRELFAIPVPVGVVAPSEIGKGVVRVAAVRIAEPFDQRTFVYRMPGDRMEFDYYRQFAAAPAALLTGEAVRALAASGRFATVLDPGSSASSGIWLESSVEQMFGDYRDPLRPAAFIRVRFFLIDTRPSIATVLGDWTFEISVPFSSDRPDALAPALGQAWGEALNRFVRASANVAVPGGA